MGGSNNVAIAQPWQESLAGTSGYTIEKYRSRYHAVPNTIPLCTTAYVGSTITIDTFVPTDAFGGEALVAFKLRVNGPQTYILAGHICHGIVQTVVNSDYFTPGSALPVVVSNNAGYLRITISGAPTGGNVTGWIKEL